MSLRALFAKQSPVNEEIASQKARALLATTYRNREIVSLRNALSLFEARRNDMC
jgi:hypothetical protein